MKVTWKYLAGILLIAFVVFSMWTLINTSLIDANSRFMNPANKQLPNISQLAFKEAGHNMLGTVVYTIRDINGYTIYVNEAQFESIPIPQKLDDNLFRMPDGSYATGLIGK